MDKRREARAGARQRWTVRKRHLEERPDDDLSATTTAEERLLMVWPLTVDAWSLSGRPIPDYAREDAPVRRLPTGTRR